MDAERMTEKILRHTDFEPLINETFEIQHGEAAYLPVVLSQLRKWGSEHRHLNGEIFQPFALIFQSTLTNQYLPQGNYLVHHPTLGQHVWFIVPHAPNAIGVEYEITFS
jgi:hypothetical protein